MVRWFRASVVLEEDQFILLLPEGGSQPLVTPVLGDTQIDMQAKHSYI